MKMKIHPWALGIGITIAVFAAAIVVMSVGVSGEHFSMVTDQYYEKGQSYQDHIEMRNRAMRLEERPEITYDPATGFCTVVFPDSLRRESPAGSVYFFRVSDSRMDFERPLQLGPDGKKKFNVSGLSGGPWVVKLRWKQGGEEYYLEKRIYID